MNKIKERFNLRSIFYLSTIIVLLIGLILIIILKNIKVIDKKIYTDNYDIYYDSTWRITSKDENNVNLKHNTGSILKIKIVTLNDYTKYENLDSSINNILYSINKKNSTNKLINKKPVKINNKDAYKVFYKSKNKNTLLTIIKESNKLILFEYTAKEKYFDIVLDSSNNIVNSFKLSHKKIDLSKTINLDKNNIRWYSNRKLNSKLNDTNKYSISSNNYKVNYTIPDIFKVVELDTTKGRYNYNDIDITTSVENINIYEYLGKDKIYEDYKYLKKKDYFREYLNQVDENEYCYKNEYQVENTTYENVELVYSLNKNHIFVVKIKSKNPITKKLIKSINIINNSNYSSNIENNINSNKLIGNLIEFTDYKKEKTEEVIIKLPVLTTEEDHNDNLYKIRYYNDQQTNTKLKYYKISNIESNNKSINNNYISRKSFGPFNNLVKNDNEISNDKEFIVYTGKYTNSQKVEINTKVLYYKLKNKFLVIEIESSNKIDDIFYYTDFEVME